MWQLFATIAVPVVSFLLGIIPTVGNRQTKSIGHHAELLEKLAGAPKAHGEMQELLYAQVVRLRAREMQKGGRPLNVGNLVGAIFFALATAGSIYGLWNWVTATSGTTWGVVAVGVLIAVAITGLVVTAALFSALYAPSKTPEERDEDKKARAERMRLRKIASAAKKARQRASQGN